MAIDTKASTATSYTTMPPSSSALPNAKVPGSSPVLPNIPVPTGLVRPRYPVHPEELDKEDFGDDSESKSKSKSKRGSAVDDLPLLAWTKKHLAKWFSYSSHSSDKEPQPLPVLSSADAIKVISKFHGQRGITLLSATQMQQMADTGYCTLAKGKIIQAPPEVQAAALKFLENNAALLKKLESSFPRTDNGAFFWEDYLEILRNGSMFRRKPELPKYYGVYCHDFYKHVMNGTLSQCQPEKYAAAKAINKFQKRYRIELLNIKQIEDMAERGYCLLPNGRTIWVAPKVQKAALEFMANACALYKKLESVVTGDYDDLFYTGNYDKAGNGGSPVSANGSNG